MAVPPGTYQVILVAGDPTRITSVYSFAVEGAAIVNGTPTTAQPWIAGTNIVTVTDGRLTVSNGAGASNNKICFIEVAPTLIQVDPPLRLIWVQRDPTGLVTCRIEGPLGRSYLMEGTMDFASWSPISIVQNLDGTISFNDGGGAAQQRRFYRAAFAP
jgi:hypothetical protein